MSVGNPELPLAPGWTWAALTDLARLESGHTPSREKPEYWGGDIGWIGIRDAREHDGGVIHDTLQTVTQAGIDNSAARVLPANTVCLSRTASVGYTVVMGRPMATSQDFVNWVCSGSLEPRFLQYAFMAEGADGLRRFGEGSTHTTIYYPEVKAFHVAFPPLGEQRRIVAKLDELRARSRKAREALAEVPALLEQLKQSVLAAAFRGDLTAKWREAHPDVEPADVLLERLRAERRRRWEEANPRKKYVPPAPVDPTTLPDLPPTWTWARLDELSDVQLGQQRAPVHAEAAEQLPYVRAANITWDGLDLQDVKAMGFPDPDRYRLHPGDVLMSEASGSPMEVGKSAIWRGELRDCYYQKTLLRLRPNGLAASEWLHLAMLQNAVAGQFAAMAPGVGIVHLTAVRMIEWPVPLAPLDEQQVLCAAVGSALESIKAVDGGRGEIGRDLDALDQALLAKAFRGELVPQDPSDEPASALLARLRASSATPCRPKSG